MIQGYLSEVGVDVSITEYDWTTYKTKVQTDPYDICFYGWTGDNGDPDNFMNLLADTNWSMNVAHFQDDEYKALIAQASTRPTAMNATPSTSSARKWLPRSSRGC